MVGAEGTGGAGEGSRVRVAVLMGGPSGEREISLRSGRAVAGALVGGRYAALPVEVARDGTLLLAGGGPGADPPAGEPSPGTDLAAAAAAARGGALGRGGPGGGGFMALHRRVGADGTVQGVLEAAGIPYTGSGVMASALAMDKDRAKALVARAGVRVARGAAVERDRWAGERAAVVADLSRRPGFPAFVKPAGGGSSIGAGPADDGPSLEARVDEVFSLAEGAALVEERLAGTEVSCAVLGNRGGPHRTLPVVEIVPVGRPFFDFKAKYDPASCEEICPARIPAAAARAVGEAAEAAHRALGCDGMSRSDFILVDGEPVYLETNTIPGMTENSLCPRAARAAGIDFPGLADLLVEMALDRFGRGRGPAA